MTSLLLCHDDNDDIMHSWYKPRGTMVMPGFWCRTHSAHCRAFHSSKGVML